MTHVYVDVLMWVFTLTFLVVGELDQHIKLIESITPSRVNTFMQRNDESVSGLVEVFVWLTVVCRVNLSHLNSRTLQARMIVLRSIVHLTRVAGFG